MSICANGSVPSPPGLMPVMPHQAPTKRFRISIRPLLNSRTTAVQLLVVRVTGIPR